MDVCEYVEARCPGIRPISINTITSSTSAHTPEQIVASAFLSLERAAESEQARYPVYMTEDEGLYSADFVAGAALLTLAGTLVKMRTRVNESERGRCECK